MVLPGYSLSAMGEQIHIASWVGFSSSTDVSLTEVCSRYHSIAYCAFVICSQGILDEQVGRKLGLDLKVGGAWTAIIEAGTGRVMAGPLPPTEEGIVYAEIDLNEAVNHYFVHEPTGHCWPKQFRVFFDAREMKPLNFREAPEMIDGSTGAERQRQELPKDTCES